MIPDLSDDEYSVLMIAAEGQSMMPIGRWEQPVELLVRKGLLERKDKFNNYITEAGRQAIIEREKGDFATGRIVADNIAEVQRIIQSFAEQAAQLLAQAAKASAKITGDSPDFAAEQWSRAILNRAQEILRS